MTRAAPAVSLTVLLGACTSPTRVIVPPAAPREVRVVPVVSRVVRFEDRVPAEIFGWYWVAIYPRVSAFAEDVLVDRSDHVRKGQLLARLVAPELVADRAQAEATLVGDRATMLRLRRAARTPGAVAKNDLELAEARAKADRERRDALRTLEGYLRVVAPFDGVITERDVHPGALVGPSSGPESQPLFRMVKLSRLRVTAEVPEADVGAMLDGAKVLFSVRAWPGRRFEGVIRRPAYALETKTRTMPVELDFENPEQRIEPGMYAEIQWPVERPVPSLLVPASAIVTTPEALFVLRVEENHVERVSVERGLAAGSLVEVFGALAPGDLVVEKGDAELTPGTEVAPHPAQPRPTAER